MSESSSNNAQYPFNYRIRVMSGIVVAQLLFLALVHFWPVTEPDNTFFVSEDDEEIQIQAPVRTRQQSTPPPPPSPTVPIPVPNDEPVPEQDVEFPDETFSESFDSLSVTSGEGGEGNDPISGDPQVPPQIVRIEEPTFQNRSPEKADIYVNFLVDKKGRVEEATIDRILLYDDNGNATLRVDRIDADVIKKTISAALNWRFRPAKENGEPVRAYKTGIFTVDY